MFRDQINVFLANAKAKAADGLTFQEIVQLFFDLIELAVTAAMSLQNSGADKKALVAASVAELYDVVSVFIPLPAIVQIFRVFLAPAIRKITLAIADGAIEWVYARIAKGNLKPAPPLVVPA